MFTAMPLTSTLSSAGMRMYFRPSMTRASIMALYSGDTEIFTSGLVILNLTHYNSLQASTAPTSPK